MGLLSTIPTDANARLAGIVSLASKSLGGNLPGESLNPTRWSLAYAPTLRM
jgi:hypothetical protein